MYKIYLKGGDYMATTPTQIRIDADIKNRPRLYLMNLA